MWVVKCEYCQVACKAQFWLYYGKWKVKRGLRELGPSPYHPDALYPFPMMIITEVVPNLTLWLGVTTWYHMVPHDSNPQLPRRCKHDDASMATDDWYIFNLWYNYISSMNFYQLWYYSSYPMLMVIILMDYCTDYKYHLKINTNCTSWLNFSTLCLPSHDFPILLNSLMPNDFRHSCILAKNKCMWHLYVAQWSKWSTLS